MAAIIATMAMIFRSIAIAPVGGPAGASGSGTETRTAYHRTAPRTISRKSAVMSAGRFRSIKSICADDGYGAGTASEALATDREMAFDGPVSTVILPPVWIVIGKRS